MIVVYLSVVEFPGHTIVTVTLSKGQHSRTIHGNQKVIKHSPAIQDFLADQALHHLANNFLNIRWRDSLEGIVERISMRDFFNPKPGSKFGLRRRIPPQVVVDLSPCPQPKQK